MNIEDYDTRFLNTVLLKEVGNTSDINDATAKSLPSQNTIDQVYETEIFPSIYNILDNTLSDTRNSKISEKDMPIETDKPVIVTRL